MDKLNFNVVEIDNGFIFQTATANLAFNTAKELVAHVRDYLGLPSQGRPKEQPQVDNVVPLHEVQS